MAAIRDEMPRGRSRILERRSAAASAKIEPMSRDFTSWTISNFPAQERNSLAYLADQSMRVFING